MVYKWAKISLFYFFLVALLGCLLRFLIIFPIDGLNFKNFLHSHSHVAFLGWIFNALFAALIYAYIPAKETEYKGMFIMLQLSVLGMMISFPIQGYAAVSIIFSTLHILLSYWFTYKFLKHAKRSGQNRKAFSWKFIAVALFFMVISSFGPFGLGAIMAKGLSGTVYYNLSIYFYLHFQYNGWFSFGVLGLFFWFLEKHQFHYNSKQAGAFFWLMAISCVPSYALSAFWIQPPLWVYSLGFLSAILQVIALAYLMLIIYDIRIQLKSRLMPMVYKLMFFSLAAFGLKVVLQMASAVPYVAELAYKLRNFTLGYLHLVFIGFVSVFLLAWFVQEKIFIIKNQELRSGLVIFLIGFIGSEAIVFLQPLLILFGWGIMPLGNEGLFVISLFMPLGLGILFFNCSIEKEEICDGKTMPQIKLKEAENLL